MVFPVHYELISFPATILALVGLLWTGESVIRMILISDFPSEGVGGILLEGGLVRMLGLLT